MEIKTKLIAPCGMDCALCHAYQREKNRCDGCREANRQCSRNCTLAACSHLVDRRCSSKCEQYPCPRLKHLDKRYRGRYNMSMLENLKQIEEVGIRAFVEAEEKKWECKKCGGTICVHKGLCLSCGTVAFKVGSTNL